MTVANTLREARALIAQQGWTQCANNVGGYIRDGEWGALCPVESIVRVVQPKRGEAIACLAIAIGGTGSIDIVAWNGVFGRTIDQVYAAFDCAIELAEAKR